MIIILLITPSGGISVFGCSIQFVGGWRSPPYAYSLHVVSAYVLVHLATWRMALVLELAASTWRFRLEGWCDKFSLSFVFLSHKLRTHYTGDYHDTSITEHWWLVPYPHIRIHILSCSFIFIALISHAHQFLSASSLVHLCTHWLQFLNFLSLVLHPCLHF